MKKYKFTAIRGFTQAYAITIEAKNEEEARWKAYDLKYNNGNEWTEVGDLEADDKLIDIERVNSKGREILQEQEYNKFFLQNQ